MKNKEEKKNKMIEIRNQLSEIFNDSKEDWDKKWWCSNLMESMSSLDMAINKIDKDKPTGIKACQ